MENALSKYLGRTDLLKAVKSLSVVQGTARETGNLYYAVEFEFINGYKTRQFLRSDAIFAWCNAFDLLDTQKQVQADF